MSHSIWIALALGSLAQAQVMNEWAELAPDDAEFGSDFGASVTISGDHLVAGAPGDSETDGGAGAAYIYDITTGKQTRKLLALDGQGSDAFGTAVDIDGVITAIGAEYDNLAGIDSGSVYIFNAVTGLQLNRIAPDDSGSSDRFGHTVAIDGGIVVSAVRFGREDDSFKGAVYVFDAMTGDQLRKISPEQGDGGGQFGFDVDIDDGIIVVGDPFDTQNGFSTGSAFIYEASTGTLLAKLLPADPAAVGGFGSSVAVSGGIVAVGAASDSSIGPRRGSVYLFDAETGAQLRKLTSSDSVNKEFLGTSVALADGIVVSGSPMATHVFGEFFHGVAYAFDASSGEQLHRLLASDAEVADLFGTAVTTGSGKIAISAPGGGIDPFTTGSVYLFDTPAAQPCSQADFAFPTGILDFNDAVAFLNAFSAMDPAADLAEPNGTLNFNDVIEFLTLFAAGCP